jgi:hypothetical protein
VNRHRRFTDTLIELPFYRQGGNLTNDLKLPPCHWALLRSNFGGEG